MAAGLEKLFFLDLDELAPFVVPAARANRVRQAHLAAVAALHQVAGPQCMVGSAAITSSR
jgi:hypothetical protein